MWMLGCFPPPPTAGEIRCLRLSSLPVRCPGYPRAVAWGFHGCRPQRGASTAGPPLRGRFSSLPRSFHSRRSRPCGGVFLHSRGASTAAGLAPAGAFFFTPGEIPQPPVSPLRGGLFPLPRSFHIRRSRPCGGVFLHSRGSSTAFVTPLRGAFFSPPGASRALFLPLRGLFSPLGSSHSSRFCGNFFVLYVYKTKKCFFRIHFLVQNMFSRVNITVVSANSG